LLDRSRVSARHLWTTADEVVLLHGDFLDKNLLLGPNGYVAIDPMPSVGDPCSDIGFFAAGRQPAGEISIRARALAERLGRDPDRAEQWALIWAIGEACETWREDSDELQAWVKDHAGTLLRGS
jgi:streptomycin 6-kinase